MGAWKHLWQYRPYLQLDYDLIKNLTLSTGIRYEHAELSVDDYKTLWGAGNKQIAGEKPPLMKPYWISAYPTKSHLIFVFILAITKVLVCLI